MTRAASINFRGQKENNMADEQNITPGNGNATADGQGKTNAGDNSNGAGLSQADVQVNIQKALDAQHLRHLKEKSALEAQIAELKKVSKSEDGKGEDLTALKDNLTSIQNELNREREERYRAQVEAIAAELNAVNGAQVAILATPYLKMVDGKLMVVNVEGQTRFNAAGQPMAVREFIGEFLNGNPHLIKASASAGAGSQGARFDSGAGGKPLTLESVKGMSIEDLKKSMGGDGLNIAGGAGQVFRFKDNKNPFAKTS